MDRLRRHSVRLADFDYARAGAYFVTLVSVDRLRLFGEIEAAEVALSELGEVVLEEWLRTEVVRPGWRMDAVVVMPNHLHGIVWIGEGEDSEGKHSTGGTGRSADGTGRTCGAPLRRPPRSLGSFVALFKAMTTRRARPILGWTEGSIWQRNYYEHIIRDQTDLERIRRYIAENPARWASDKENRP